MSQDLREFITESHELLALGEPTHQEPGFAHLRNELFPQLIAQGFRSIALEIDRVAALTVDDHVQHGLGEFEQVLAQGFSHGFGELAGNRQLIAWLREYNRRRPATERIACYGFDMPGENYTSHSPRVYLEHARDYLGLDCDIAGLLGPDERWNTTEVVLNVAASRGGSPEALRAAALGEDLRIALHSRAPELIAATSLARWRRARTHLTAGLGLLSYHRQLAQRVPEDERITRLSATRDVLMAQNLLEIREIEAERGPTLVFSHNLHLRRTPSRMRMGEHEINWAPAGAIVAATLGERYAFVAGSLGRSDAIALGEPAVDTFEAELGQRFGTWGLTPVDGIAPARTRTDTEPRQGYFPIDAELLNGTDAVLHLRDGAAIPV